MSVFNESIATPFALVRLRAVQHNVATMRAFCEQSGVQLAPHVKTTMSRELVALQMTAGAWGAAVAAAAQGPTRAGLGPDAGGRRRWQPNEVVDPVALSRWRSRARAAPTLCWYVDSYAGLDLAARHAGSPEQPARLLLELGHDSGRTGVRDDVAALDLAHQVAATDGVCLAGVAGYEGTLGFVRDESTVSAVDSFLRRIHDMVQAIRDDSSFDLSFDARHPVVVTAGGSTYFDRVATILGPLADDETDVVLRSGCYLTHDHGVYARSSPTARADWPLEPFRAALEVWGRVLSLPEPGLALVDVGRRDASYDAGLPRPLQTRRIDGTAPRSLRGSLVTRLNDQHAYVESVDADLRIGDLVGFGISHPCTTFDRWRTLHLVDDDDAILGEITTAFA